MSRSSQRAEQEELRIRMHAAGMSRDEIAVELGRRYRLRPRAAHRLACGWSQTQAAAHLNAHAARLGLDPTGKAAMTGAKLSELELWPHPMRRRPTPQILALLAEAYGTDIHHLLDLDDREHLTPADLHLLATIRAKGAPAESTEAPALTEPVDHDSAVRAGQLNRQQFLIGASVVGVSTAILPNLQSNNGPASAGRESASEGGGDLLAELREAITAPTEQPSDRRMTSAVLDELAALARDCHSRYQEADFASAARLLPVAVRGVEALAADPPAGVDPRMVGRTRAAVYIAAAKLATKTGDHGLAWLAADRGQHAALIGDAPALVATARRQIACVFHDTGRPADAERLALEALDALNGRRSGIDDPDVVSARGALLLLAAMISVRRDDRAEAHRRLDAAADQAAVLGQDDNRLWSAFGPTNVAIHALAAAQTLDDPAEAVRIGAQIDTRLLPAPLAGRHARVHVDLASAHTSLGENDVAAVHILDVARRAPQMLRFDPVARSVVTTLLHRARGSTVPILRSVAEQTGISA
ncbi:hypothetical protein MXD59_21255 [Frankia sp. Ag45/Mut15]|uniref:Transcriptional regulator, XRE family n=1 Tax=Frankia umida TaxID=573489 RepID=A0ABT0K3A6_9ACTN|nr:hypothetical protein [Frankia umida]MCK9878266.1 hypothetical protein [Frankia umida]